MKIRNKKSWQCWIGETGSEISDSAMRDYAADGFKKVTGHNPDFIFSGWGESLPEEHRAVVEDRLPRVEKMNAGITGKEYFDLFDRINELESQLAERDDLIEKLKSAHVSVTIISDENESANGRRIHAEIVETTVAADGRIVLLCEGDENMMDSRVTDRDEKLRVLAEYIDKHPEESLELCDLYEPNIAIAMAREILKK
jgi:hypothetical protein